MLTVCRKDENKEKEAGNYPFLIKHSSDDENFPWFKFYFQPFDEETAFKCG